VLLVGHDRQHGVTAMVFGGGNVEILYHAARKPKNLVWLDSRHVNPRNVKLTRTVIQVLERLLMRLDVLVLSP